MNYLIFLPLILLSSLNAIDLDKANSILNNKAVADTTKSLAYAVKENSPSWFSLIAKMGIMLLIVIVFIYLFILFMKKFQSKRVRRGNLSNELYDSIGIAPLTYNKQLQVIKFYDKIYLLGISEKNITLIDKFEKGEEIRDIENSIDRTTGEGFGSILKKSVRKVDGE
ncbi:MAG: hypothetical protein CR982_02730 [Candidatus Cloacimonadota bacterium]|nr:MAG: hypothetical protein CR982_02730 [Candidatus Cloacimonadota bacterium]PIE79345.1 MAG: hypothetical protein CSA15_03585 [Candidatus Delongbacteria bacterium]